MTISEAQAARARYIRTLLAWHDLTQADLAKLLGISQPAANRKLKGKRRFDDDELLAIADAFDLDPANMLRPPQLSHVMGCVPSAAGTLLTCTYRKLRRSEVVSGRLPNIHSPVEGIVTFAA